MNTNISQLEPTIVWKNFYLLTQTPRPSKHEEKVRKFLVDWAAQHSVQCKVDETGNIIFSKPATHGYEHHKGIILQAHCDMVPQKNSDKKHDFETDPIEAYIDGEWVTANGTTLGADNGMGVAAIMAVFESKDMEHPALEALITIDEETGMTGAFGLKKGELKGSVLLNLDSEEEGELCIGCAGGLDATITLPYRTAAMPAEHTAFKITVKGLKGGHSGVDIHLGRGNANKIITRLIVYLMQKSKAQVCSINGGNMRNAVPREAEVIIAVPNAKTEKLQSHIAKFTKVIKAELSIVDPDFTVEFTPVTMPSEIIVKSFANKITRLLYAIPNGVIRMSDTMPMVETSTNLAIVKTENGILSVSCLLRSSVDSAKEELGQTMVLIAKLAGGKCELSGAYPGWKPNIKSPILKVMKDVYARLFGNEPTVGAIHAGLECGLFAGVYKNWDMISFGPTVMYPHSPDEKVNIASVDKFWKYLINVLKSSPK
jgi:dipeptidase D